MKLYIDPSTGSMLFAVLIGILGAVNWMLKGWIVKLHFLLTGGKGRLENGKKIPFVIFSDDKRYWSVFEPVCNELDKRGFDTVYMTASPDDPALKHSTDHFSAQFIGEGNKAYAKLNFLNARVLLATTPGLEVYQWKRSKEVDYYIHMQHAANDISGYRMFGIDYFDAILISGDYQRDEIRELERLRNLPAKEVELIGIPYMDEMLKRLHAAPPVQNEKKIVLLAPSWGKSAIFSKYGGKILDVLLKTDYHIIVRPHPQSFTSEKERIEEIMERYPASEQLEWNRDPDNFEVLRKSDILISDFSGVIFDFSLVYDKPIIYADTEFDNSPYDSCWIDAPYWTFTALPRIGEKLTQENLDDLPMLIRSCLTEQKYVDGRIEARSETWCYPGEGAKRAADYLIEKYRTLANNAGTESK